MNFKKTALLLVVTIAQASCAVQSGTIETPPSLQPDYSKSTDFSPTTLSKVKFGQYAVGTKIIFATDDSQRFDPWNTAYASPEYRELLEQVEKSGQKRTVATSIWYPAQAKATHVAINHRLRTPIKAVSGQQAKMSDYVFEDPKMYQYVANIFLEEKGHVLNRDGESLESAEKNNDVKQLDKFVSELMSQKRGAYLNAPIAKGKFPVVILSHGLGGNYVMWDRAGEFLASHGYIVAAPTFISDGSSPIVFHDPASKFAKTHSKQDVYQAYKVLSEPKVVPNFVKFLFGVELTSPEQMMNFNPSQHTIVPGGP